MRAGDANGGFRALVLEGGGVLQKLAVVCLVMAVAGLTVSLTLAPPAVPWTLMTEPSLEAVLPLLPSAAAVAALLAGLLCLAAERLAEGAPEQADPEPDRETVASVSPSRETVEALRALLADERHALASLREQCSTSTNEAMAVGARLAAFVLDAETRLSAGVAQVEQVLREPEGAVVQAAEASLRVERALPEIAELIRRCMVEPATTREELPADNAVQSFRAIMADATSQIAALSDATALLRGEVAAMHDAGRQVAAAGVDAAARTSETASQVDSALSQLPAAAAAVTAAAGQAAQTATALQQDAAALRTIGQDLLASTADVAARVAASAGIAAARVIAATTGAGSVIQGEVETLRAAGQELTAAGQEAAAKITHETAEAAARIAAEAAGAADGLRAETAVLAEAGQAVTGAARQATAAIVESIGTAVTDLTDSAASLRQQADTLRSTGTDLAAAGEQAAAAFGQTAQTATSILATATTAIHADTAALRTAAQEVTSAGNSAASAVTGAAAEASEKLAAVTTDVVAVCQGAAGLGDLTVVLSAATTKLTEGAHDLDDTGRRVAAAGEAISAQLGASTKHAEAMLTLANSLSADIAAAGDGVRHDAAVLTATAHSMVAAGETASTAFADATSRVALYVAAVEESDRRIGAANDQVAAQARYLATVAGDLASQAAPLPAVAAQIAETGDLLRVATAACTAGAAALSDGAGPRFDRLDALGNRLAQSADQLSAAIADHARQADAEPDVESSVRDALVVETLTRLTALSAEVVEVVRRLEAASGQRDGAGEALAESLRRVVAAIDAADWTKGAAASADRLDAVGHRLEVSVRDLSTMLGEWTARAAAPPEHDALLGRTLNNLTDLSSEISGAVRRLETAVGQQEGAGEALVQSIERVGAAVDVAVQAAVAADRGVTEAAVRPDMLTSTLRQLNGVDQATAALLGETEALAEAVLTGRAPGIPPLLAARTPALLADVETTIQRLRSVATALAIASDGQPAATQGSYGRVA
jgi:hypothetical protein